MWIATCRTDRAPWRWDAYVAADGAFGTSARKTGRLRLIDVAAKDDRAAATSAWVYGTFN
jgi:hypothetical protein